MTQSPAAGVLDRLRNTAAVVERLSALRPTRIDPAAISRRAKIPYKVADLVGGLTYRVVELSKAALGAFSVCHLAVAIVLSRAALETAAALWYVARKVEATIEADRIGDFDDVLMRMLLGFKARAEDWKMPSAINVLNFLDTIDQEVPGFRGHYEDLCEFAHPNWSGTAYLYSKPDTKNVWTDYGSDVRDLDVPYLLGSLALEITVVTFEHFLNRVGEIMPKLIELAERDLDDRPR
jgi:hypothetical protein